MKTSILIVSPETKKEFLPESVLNGMEPTLTADFPTSQTILKKRRFDVCFIHRKSWNKADFYFLKKIQKTNGAMDCLIALKSAQIPVAIELLDGNWDYVVVPYGINELKLKFARILEKRKLERENHFWRMELTPLLASRGALTTEDIPTEIWEKAGDGKPGMDGQMLQRSRREFERECLRRALERAQGSQTQAAKTLGIHRNTLIWKLKKLNLVKECQKIVSKRRGLSWR